MIIWGKATSFQPLLVKFGEWFVSPVSRTVSDTFLVSTRFPVHGILVCHQEQTMTGHKILVPRTLLWWRNGKGPAWLSVIHFHFPPRVVRDTQVSHVNKLFNHMSTTFSSSYKYVNSPRLLYSFLSFLSFYFCVFRVHESMCEFAYLYPWRGQNKTGGVFLYYSWRQAFSPNQKLSPSVYVGWPSSSLDMHAFTLRCWGYRNKQLSLALYMSAGDLN